MKRLVGKMPEITLTSITGVKRILQMTPEIQYFTLNITFGDFKKNLSSRGEDSVTFRFYCGSNSKNTGSSISHSATGKCVFSSLHTGKTDKQFIWQPDLSSDRHKHSSSWQEQRGAQHEQEAQSCDRDNAKFSRLSFQEVWSRPGFNNTQITCSRCLSWVDKPPSEEETLASGRQRGHLSAPFTQSVDWQEMCHQMLQNPRSFTEHGSSVHADSACSSCNELY